MQEELAFTCGDKPTAIDIMREAAQWLVDAGRPMWDLDDLSEDKISAPPDEFHVAWLGSQSVAAMTLSFEDRFLWPGIPANTSGFIHKLSIRRRFAGKGYAELLVNHAKEICVSRGTRYLRLDCDPHRAGLCKLYEKCGFQLVERKSIETRKFGKLGVALYEWSY